MVERDTPIAAVRERLTGLLADWGAELSVVLKELEDTRAEVEALRRQSAEQASVGDALAEKERELAAKAVEIERLRSELGSKQELLRALRRDAETADRAKAEVKLKDRELESLKAAAAKAEQRTRELEQQLAIRDEAAENRAAQEESEVEALRAELEARKTLIKSLRTDQERVAALQADLDEKREVISQLEATVTRHSGTIAELKRSVDMWKRKYRAVADTSATSTATQVPAFTETDVRALERAERDAGENGDATIAIDMRRSLLEARRTAARGQREK